jgi:hypothetical protein
MSGRRHKVLGGIAVGAAGKVQTRLVETVVRFKRLEPSEIECYIQSGEWRGKAGGYAIQGRAATFVAFLSGFLQQCGRAAAVRDGGAAEGGIVVSRADRLIVHVLPQAFLMALTAAAAWPSCRSLRRDRPSLVDGVFLGRLERVMPELDAAFVEIGTGGRASCAPRIAPASTAGRRPARRC